MTILELAAVTASASLALGVLLLVLYLLLSRQGRRQSVAEELRPAEKPSRSDVRRMMDELADLAEQIDVRMDSRIQQLQEAIGQADARLRQLRQSQEPPCRPDYQTVGDPAHGEILRLDRQGLDAVEIARRMEMDIGEVELVLNLNRDQSRHQ
ncbi:MAG: DUF6115 domain-containing protein [Phycisphaerae bacterium]